MSEPRRHPILGLEQINQYFDRLHIAVEKRIVDVTISSAEEAYEYLSLLQRQHLVHIPFENLSLHYSRSRHISLHIDDLFRKLIETPGRGGYCMENNALFAALLRSLNYKVRSCGARTHNGKVFGGWSHHINLVTIANEVHVTDVGYGSNNSIVPLSLQKPGEVIGAIASETVRLIYTPLDDNEDPAQKLWVFQHRYGPSEEWRNCYCFTELEFRPEDFEIMNAFTSSSPRRFFTQRVFCTRMVLDDTGTSIVGRLTLQKEVKRSIGDKVEILRTFSSEADRLAALRDFFGIEIDDSGAKAILGTVAEIDVQ